MKRPGDCEKVYVPFNHFRANELYQGINDNEALRILSMNPCEDFYREVAMFLSFWLRAQMKTRVVVTDEPGKHDTPLKDLFGASKRSRLIDLIIQQDDELADLRNYTRVTKPEFY